MPNVLEAFSKQVEKLDGLEDSVERIASATEETAITLKGINEAIRDLRSELVDAATSKKSVPSSVFLIFLLAAVALLAIEKLTNTNTDLHVNERGLHIEQRPHGAK